jgi:circadian clock protein KaiC
VSGFEVPEEPAQRVSSGVAGLDTLLRGGWLRGGTYIITGVPGAGKTILGNQFCFSSVAQGGNAVYATVLAESHGRMMKHLESLSFFRRDAVGRALHYVSGYATLKSEGLPGLSRLLFRAVREHQASALVLDGMSAVEESADSRLAFREFLHGLSVHNGLAHCTTLLLTGHPGAPVEPHFGLVDGVVVLTPEQHGLATVRSVEVTKLRGTGQLPGKHTYSIDSEGLRVFPRTEAVHVAQSQVVPDPQRRLKFGIPRLDTMLGGGLVADSSTLLLGSPGSGKTLLGLHFLAEGARHQQPGLFYGFSETPQRLVQKASLVSLDLRPHVASGLLRMEDRAAVETLPDALAHELLGLVERHRIQRLFVDGVEPFSQELIDPRRTARFFTAVTNALRDRHVTVVWTEQTPALFGPELSTTPPAVGAIVDNIVFMRYVEMRSQLNRLLSILKMRESDNDSNLRLLSISPQGIDVAETFESAESVLTGEARPLQPKKKKPAKGLLRRRRRS